LQRRSPKTSLSEVEAKKIFEGEEISYGHCGWHGKVSKMRPSSKQSVDDVSYNTVSAIVASCFVLFIDLGDTSLLNYAAKLSNSVQAKGVEDWKV
jgi:hypothetical protein